MRFRQEPTHPNDGVTVGANDISEGKGVFDVATKPTANIDIFRVHRTKPKSPPIQARKAPILGRNHEIRKTPQPQVRCIPNPKVKPNRPETQATAPAKLSMREELNEFREMVATRFDGLGWLDLDVNHSIQGNLMQVLLRAGISPPLAREILHESPDGLDLDTCRRFAIAALGSRITILDDALIQSAERILLCGPTGVGKTLQATKLAARSASIFGSDAVSLLSTDDQKLGAQHQLKVFGARQGIAVYAAENSDELGVCMDCVSDYRVVVVDTAGKPMDEFSLRETMTRFDSSTSRSLQFVVLSATTDYQSLAKTVEAAMDIGVDGCIVTKLDEAAVIGPVLSAVIEADLPIAYLSAGQRVPEDLERPSAVGLAQDALCRGDETPFHASVPSLSRVSAS